MAQAPTIQTNPYSRYIPASRVPAIAPAITSRKKPQSVRVGTNYWVQPPSAPSLKHRSRFSSALLLVLPSLVRTPNALQVVTAVVADFLIVVMNSLLAYFVIHSATSAKWSSYATRDIASGAIIGLSILQASLITLLAHSERLYEPANVLKAGRIASARVVIASTLLLLLCCCAQAPGLTAVIAFACTAPFNFGWLVLRRACQEQSIGPYACSKKNVLVIGNNVVARNVASQCEERDARRVFRGFISEDGEIGGDVRGSVADLARVARAEFVDEIIVAAPGRRDLAERAMWEAYRNRLDLKLVPDFLGCSPSSVQWEMLGDTPLLALHQEPMPALGLAVKRTIDVIGAALLLLMTSPLIALVAILINIDSPGPVFYRAQRVGKKGVRFCCYKFRTMTCDAEARKAALLQRNERHGPFFKITDDPRVTRLGRWLRRYSIDEVPQLWNVLRGEMSLVGPRPHPEDDFARYRIDDFRRLDVTPGLTGLWQVTARHDPSFEKNMALDLEYIETWSLRQDWRILAKTVTAVLKGNGS